MCGTGAVLGNGCQANGNRAQPQAETSPRGVQRDANQNPPSEDPSSAIPRAGFPPSPQSPSPQRKSWPSFETISAKLRPSVVSVMSRVDGPKGQRWGMASGVVVGAQKHVLTNAHALTHANKIYVQQGQGSYLAARVLAQDPRVDLALLELLPPSPDRLDSLIPIQWSSRTPRPGQWAICMGHPYGLGHTVTVGVVSGLGRDYDDMGRPAGLDPQGWWSMMQIDAAVNVGNSGGPVVDDRGQAMGIATAIRQDGQGLAFAIPASMAQHFVHEAQTHGTLRRAHFGAKVQEAGPETLPGRLQSLVVLRVDPQGPAFKAGLRPGDILLRTQERPLHRLSALAFEIQRRGVGGKLTLWVQSPPAMESPDRKGSPGAASSRAVQPPKIRPVTIELTAAQ